MQITKTSGLTKKLNTMEVPITEEQYKAGVKAWQDGAFIQDAFPMLSAAHREFLLTGITPDDWDRFVGEDE